MTIDLRAVGAPEAVRVRDLWSRTDEGVVRGRLTRRLPVHGAALYRLAPA